MKKKGGVRMREWPCGCSFDDELHLCRWHEEERRRGEEGEWPFSELLDMGFYGPRGQLCLCGAFVPDGVYFCFVCHGSP